MFKVFLVLFHKKYFLKKRSNFSERDDIIFWQQNSFQNRILPRVVFWLWWCSVLISIMKISLYISPSLPLEIWHLQIIGNCVMCSNLNNILLKSRNMNKNVNSNKIIWQRYGLKNIKIKYVHYNSFGTQTVPTFVLFLILYYDYLKKYIYIVKFTIIIIIIDVKPIIKILFLGIQVSYNYLLFVSLRFDINIAI